MSKPHAERIAELEAEVKDLSERLKSVAHVFAYLRFPAWAHEEVWKLLNHPKNELKKIDVRPPE